MEIINPQDIKKAEIVVGIPSYNEATRIGFIVEQVSLGLKKYFPNKKSVIINLDNNSTDSTQEAFFQVETAIPKIYISTTKKEKGKGYNFYNLFLIAKELEAKVILTFDADLESIQPNWVKKMAEPVFEGYEFVAPYYTRYKNDATITNAFVYPLVYGLLGWDIRQPIGGDFAFSDKMIDYWLKEKWTQTTYQFGIDIFMSLSAFFNKNKVGQVNLGTKIHKLGKITNQWPMFLQVTETLFEIISNNRAQIKDKVEIDKVIIFGGEELPILADIEPDYQYLREFFLSQIESYRLSMKDIISQTAKQKIKEIRKDKQVIMDGQLWTEIVYDFLFAYGKSDNKRAIIEILKCLYFVRLACFFEQISNLTPGQTEKEIIKQAEYFFNKRDYFLNK